MTSPQAHDQGVYPQQPLPHGWTCPPSQPPHPMLTYNGSPVGPPYGVYGYPIPLGTYPPPMRKVGLSAGMHLIHATMTLFTAGFWIPIWIWHAMSAARRVRY